MMNVYSPADTLALPPFGQETPPFRWLPHMLRFLRRRWLAICGTAGAVLGLAVLYLLVATPQFTAVTTLLIDVRQSNPFRQQPIVADAQYENTLVESQVEVVRSEGLARLIVARHDLARDADFNIGRGIIGSVVGFVADLVGNDEPLTEERLQALAVERLMKLVAVRRIGLTAVIEVSVRTPNRVLSARLANALTEAYLQNQLSALSEVSAQASNWMQKRIHELREQAITADRAVQDYRADNNILDTDKGQFNEQQLGEVSTQLSQARARLAEAQSKFERLRSINPGQLADAPMTEALENTVIVGLRRQYLDARRRDSEWSSRYGAGHTAAVNARSEMAELQRSIQNELNRISETYRSELEIAKANEMQVGQQLAALSSASAAANTDRIMLRALKSSAESYKTIFENFLQRYTQAVQDQSFPIPEARVMTPALPPLKKSQPKTVIVLGLGVVLGIVLGMGFAGLRELLDQGLRTPAQVKEATGHDCLGLVPRLPARSRRAVGGQAAEPSVRQLATHPSALRHAADQPQSPFAEAMRGIALRTAWRRNSSGSQVIGCVSPRPGDGASTVAANLAQAFTEAGYRTLLVDLDLRRPDLTHALASQNAGGAAEIAEGALSLDEAVWRDVQTGLHFLPAAAGRSAAHPARLLAPARADRLVAAFRAGYDRVVIDLPAFGDAADAGAVAKLLDGLLLVSGWGGMEGGTLAELLDDLGDGRDKLLGIVLNRVEVGRLGHYGVVGHGLSPRRGSAAIA